MKLPLSQDDLTQAERLLELAPQMQLTERTDHIQHRTYLSATQCEGPTRGLVFDYEDWGFTEEAGNALVQLLEVLPELIKQARYAESLRTAAEPFTFTHLAENPEDQTTQDVWEMLYRERICDWISYDDIDQVRLALANKEEEQ